MKYNILYGDLRTAIGPIKAYVKNLLFKKALPSFYWSTGGVFACNYKILFTGSPRTKNDLPTVCVFPIDKFDELVKSILRS